MTTIDTTRGRFSGVCVEITLNKSLKPTMMIMGRIIHVEYEGLSNICFGCGLCGHKTEVCPRNQTLDERTTSTTQAHRQNLRH